MSITNNGGPAFPCLEATVTGIDSDGHERIDTEAHGGMSLRDYFAAKALAACIGAHITHFGHGDHWPEAGVAQYAYDLADAMLAERVK